MKKIFGIIGDPVKHSLSPLLHNYWFKKYKVNAIYSILNVDSNNLVSVIQKLKDKSLNTIQKRYILENYLKSWLKITLWKAI